MVLEGTLSRSVREALECSICFERFSKDYSNPHRPVVLPCRHVVCYQCAMSAQLTQDEAHPGYVKCPTCREPFLQESPLPISQEVLRVLASVFSDHDADAAPSAPLPPSSGDSPTEPPSPAPTCSIHMGKVLELYCKGDSCRRLVCELCAKTRHLDDAKHPLIHISEPEFTEVAKRIAREAISKLEQVLTREADCARALEERRSGLRAQKEAGERQIREFFAHLRIAVDAREQELLAEIKKPAEERDRVLALEQKQHDESAAALRLKRREALDVIAGRMGHAVSILEAYRTQLSLHSTAPMAATAEPASLKPPPHAVLLLSSSSSSEPLKAAGAGGFGPVTKAELGGEASSKTSVHEELVVSGLEGQELLERISMLGWAGILAADAKKCVLTQPEGAWMAPGSQLVFRLFTADSEGKPMSRGGAAVSVDGDGVESLSVEDVGDGTYVISGTVVGRGGGKAAVRVKVGGEEVADSPLVIALGEGDIGWSRVLKMSGARYASGPGMVAEREGRVVRKAGDDGAYACMLSQAPVPRAYDGPVYWKMCIRHSLFGNLYLGVMVVPSDQAISLQPSLFKSPQFHGFYGSSGGYIYSGGKEKGGSGSGLPLREGDVVVFKFERGAARFSARLNGGKPKSIEELPTRGPGGADVYPAVVLYYNDEYIELLEVKPDDVF